jgi:hypothetical protein
MKTINFRWNSNFTKIDAFKSFNPSFFPIHRIHLMLLASCNILAKQKVYSPNFMNLKNISKYHNMVATTLLFNNFIYHIIISVDPNFNCSSYFFLFFYMDVSCKKWSMNRVGKGIISYITSKFDNSNVYLNLGPNFNWDFLWF